MGWSLIGINIPIKDKFLFSIFDNFIKIIILSEVFPKR